MALDGGFGPPKVVAKESTVSDTERSDNERIKAIRKEYQRAILDEKTISADPLTQFRNWFDEACAVEQGEANACALATASLSGMPSVRAVLMKKYDAHGYVFYTHYDSRKGEELIANPRAALLFYWPIAERQVRIEGHVTQVSKDESDEYFFSRPRSAQIGASVSRQSRVVGSREAMELAVEKIEQESAHKPLVRPATWGGFRVYAERYEFWQGREGRMHDRILYEQSTSEWRYTRLWP
jgi:pyridoxamine 5'-phosphate oxidase